jgi:cytochrome c553
MHKRLAVLIGFVILVTLSAQPARADDPPGAKLFLNYCSGCHGPAGQGGMAPSIGGKDFLSAHNDAAIILATSQGVVVKGMPAWSKANGGTLSDTQIADIVAYLGSLAPGVAAQTAAVDPSVSNASPPSDAPPAADVVPVQTKIELKQLLYQDGRILVRAQLMEPDGYPVAGATIAFSRPTQFGAIDLGTAKTGANGVASVTVTDAPPTGQVAAVFKGNQNWIASSVQAALAPHAVASSGGFDLSRISLSIGEEPLVPPEGNLITPNPPLIPAALFLGVVGCVWSLYAFVVSQVVGIWRAGRIAKRQNTLTWKAK